MALKFGKPDWAPLAQEFVDSELDAENFSVEVLQEMALEQVSDPKRKVHFVDDKEEDVASQRMQWVERRWYAVELRCDGRVVFFKIKFLRDSDRRTMVVSCHWQKDADVWT
jgi:hypothetical protein